MGNSIGVPYSVRVTESVRVGSSVTICGRPHPNCHRFSINLCSGPNVAGEVPLHFNPRFDKGYVCCNSMYNGKWASEVHTSLVPFARDVAFEIQIKADSSGYVITVNDRNYCQFPYRLPKETTQFLVIAGDISLDYVFYSQPELQKAPRRQGVPIPNPIQIPFSTPIPVPVKEGFVVNISGRPFPDCRRFSINLSNGPSLTGEVALHFNPRFDKGYVCCNSMYSGKWASEQHTSPIPFSKNMDFDMKVKADSNGYQMIVNGVQHCSFPHRLPRELARHLVIHGDVYISSIHFDEPAPIPHVGFPQRPVMPPSYEPAPTPHIGFPQRPVMPPSYSQSMSMPPPVVSQPLYPKGPFGNSPNLTMPLNLPVAGGMFDGKIILIVGKVNPNASRFSVNLMKGPSFTLSDILFHFDVRLRYGNDTNAVVRNHRQDNQWGGEEKDITSFPFHRKANFNIMVLAESSCFKVAVNDNHFVTFRHRVYPYEQATYLNVTGDVQLSTVQFQ